jgi:hypothetical protein
VTRAGQCRGGAPFSLTELRLKGGSSLEKEMACSGILKGGQIKQAIGRDGTNSGAMSANGLHSALVF